MMHVKAKQGLVRVQVERWSLLWRRVVYFRGKGPWEAAASCLVLSRMEFTQKFGSGTGCFDGE